MSKKTKLVTKEVVERYLKNPDVFYNEEAYRFTHIEDTAAHFLAQSLKKNVGFSHLKTY